jgi:hypothetical protein
MTRRHITQEDSYKGFQLYSGDKNADGFYTDILDRLFDGVETFLTHRSRINVFRFELYFKDANGEYVEQGNEDHLNKLVSKFFEKLVKKLNRVTDQQFGKGRREDKVFYTFVREQSGEKKTHFHCTVITRDITTCRQLTARNAQGEEEYISVYRLIDETWRSTCELGYVHFGSTDKKTGKLQYHFYIVNRKNRDELAEALKGLSYLGKVQTKENTPKGKSTFRSSQAGSRGEVDFKLTEEVPPVS